MASMKGEGHEQGEHPGAIESGLKRGKWLANRRHSRDSSFNQSSNAVPPGVSGVLIAIVWQRFTRHGGAGVRFRPVNLFL